MIYCGLSPVTCLLVGITVALVALDAALCITASVLERKIANMREGSHERL
ncbi:MAG: hypothetical protein IJD10_02490 [Clostridia bacterium]|nr:hypothetical protein [Clostridia bacterium]